MKNFILILISIFITINPVLSAKPESLVRKVDAKVTYVKIRKDELELLKRQAFISKDILDRLSDLEKLFRTINNTIDGIVSTVNIVKKILNIQDAPETGEEKDENKYELPSGMILSPGYIDFKAKFYDPTNNFSTLGIKALDFDVFYNKNLFAIDHIEGDGVYGNQFKFISLPQSSSTLKDRIQLPLSDILLKEVEFQIYFVPRNASLAKTGDTSEVEVKNYKKPIKDPNGENVSVVIYELGLSSPDFIKITKK